MAVAGRFPEISANHVGDFGIGGVIDPRLGYEDEFVRFEKLIRNCSGRLRTLLMTSWNGPRFHDDAMVVRMIEYAKKVEFI